eukprot:2532556-Pyramimonas_sp.AAC.1
MEEGRQAGDPPRQCTCEDSAKMVQKAAAKIGMHSAAPYLARHSGASIDALNHLGPLGEIRKRGRWR